jgi:hypothetical protein
MPSYSGVWTLTAQYQAKGANNWPDPNAPIGVFGSYGSTAVSQINIATTGNSTSFGSLITAMLGSGAASSTTRAVFANGDTNAIEYLTYASVGTALDFGDRTLTKTMYGNSMSNATRGVFGGGETPYTNVIDYITIATTGDAIDFGDLLEVANGVGSCASTTRGLFMGLRTNAGPYINVIQYVTIATTGNTTDFGDLTQGIGFANAYASAVRGCRVGGYAPSASTNVIDYVTIASTGNATDFGDLTVARYGGSTMASPTRGVMANGESNSGSVNVIDYVTIATTGNAIDFGDSSSTQIYSGGTSMAAASVQP